MNKTTLERDARRADQARRLLEDPLLVEAMNAIEKAAFEAFKNSHASDAVGRERLYQFTLAQKKFKDYFFAVVQDGVIAEKRLNDDLRRETQEGPIKRFFGRKTR